jgi:hypothetical protein
MRAISINRDDEFGDLVVISEVERKRDSAGKLRRQFLCRCKCGNETVVPLGRLRSGNTTTCGCGVREGLLRSLTKHGLCGSKIYAIWKGMVGRCRNENHPVFKNYGARGIEVCREWIDSPESFCRWAVENGWEDGLDIDRIDNNGNYERSNCRFVTHKENTRNTRSNVLITFNGETLCQTAMAEKYNINISTLRSRLSSGWSIEDAITTPVSTQGVRNCM